MNTPTEHRNKWQISLANVLVFVFAVGLWFLTATLASNAWLSNATLVVMLSGMVGSFLAWRRGRLGILVLLLLFEFAVVGQLLGLSYLRALNSERYQAKRRLLRTVSSSLSAYYSDWGAFPPPPADPKLGSADLARYLTLKMKRGPYLLNTPQTSNWVEFNDGVARLVGARRHALTWVLTGKDKFILIDMGEDGLPGQYTWDGTDLLKTPVDANKNGLDDGDDDAAMGGSWDRLP